MIFFMYSIIPRGIYYWGVPDDVAGVGVAVSGTMVGVGVTVGVGSGVGDGVGVTVTPVVGVGVEVTADGVAVGWMIWIMVVPGVGTASLAAF